MQEIRIQGNIQLIFCHPSLFLPPSFDEVIKGIGDCWGTWCPLGQERKHNYISCPFSCVCVCLQNYCILYLMWSAASNFFVISYLIIRGWLTWQEFSEEIPLVTLSRDIEPNILSFFSLIWILHTLFKIKNI
jgi:hypothetical protein